MDGPNNNNKHRNIIYFKKYNIETSGTTPTTSILMFSHYSTFFYQYKNYQLKSQSHPILAPMFVLPCKIYMGKIHWKLKSYRRMGLKTDAIKKYFHESVMIENSTWQKIEKSDIKKP